MVNVSPRRKPCCAQRFTEGRQHFIKSDRNQRSDQSRAAVVAFPCVFA